MQGAQCTERRSEQADPEPAMPRLGGLRLVKTPASLPFFKYPGGPGARPPAWPKAAWRPERAAGGCGSYPLATTQSSARVGSKRRKPPISQVGVVI